MKNYLFLVLSLILSVSTLWADGCADLEYMSSNAPTNYVTRSSFDGWMATECSLSKPGSYWSFGDGLITLNTGGALVSPTLKDGLSKLTFYLVVPCKDNGVSVTIYITDSKGTVSCSKSCYGSYNYALISLEPKDFGRTSIEGNFTITMYATNARPGLFQVCWVSHKDDDDDDDDDDDTDYSIVLDKDTLSLEVGESGEINITTLKPTDANIGLAFSKTGIAAYNEVDGKFVGMSAGITTVFFYVMADATHYYAKDSCIITVTNPSGSNVDPTGVTLSASTLTMAENSTATLTATVAPTNATDKSVIWESSNPTVVSVDENGNLTSYGAGSATITVTTKNGKTATCSVTVSTDAPAATLSLNKETLTLTEGASETLTATYTPDTAKLTWTSSHPSIATVDNTGKVTAVTAGTATITVSSSAGKTANCALTVEEETEENDSSKVHVTSVDFDCKPVYVGDTIQFTATYEPDNATETTQIWSSNNEACISVDQTGKIIVHKAGTATIKLQIDHAAKTCKITVPEPASTTKIAVKFVDWDDSPLKTDSVVAGGSANPPTNLSRLGYTFDHWEGSYTNVQKEEIVKAVYTENKPSTFTVKFINWDSSILKTETVNPGGAATPPANPTRPNYTFDHWEGAYTNVNADASVTAVFKRNEEKVEEQIGSMCVRKRARYTK